MSVYEIITQKIIDELEKGICPWKKSWNPLGLAPMNYESKRAYSGINQILLSGYDSPYFLTFNQIKKMGAKLKKGSKSANVVYYNFYEKEIIDEFDEIQIEQKVALKYYNVFNATDIEGIKFELPQKIILNEFEKNQICENIINDYISNEGVNLSFDLGEAYYNQKDDRVNMPSLERFFSLEEYYGTFFHELVHSTGHKKRLNRNLGNFFDGVDEYSKEELIAEIGSAFLSNLAGIEAKSSFENSVSYIANWLKVLKNDKSLIITAAANAQKAADLIYKNNAFMQTA